MALFFVRDNNGSRFSRQGCGPFAFLVGLLLPAISLYAMMLVQLTKSTSSRSTTTVVEVGVANHPDELHRLYAAQSSSPSSTLYHHLPFLSSGRILTAVNNNDAHNNNAHNNSTIRRATLPPESTIDATWSLHNDDDNNGVFRLSPSCHAALQDRKPMGGESTCKIFVKNNTIIRPNVNPWLLRHPDDKDQSRSHSGTVLLLRRPTTTTTTTVIIIIIIIIVISSSTSRVVRFGLRE